MPNFDHEHLKITKVIFVSPSINWLYFSIYSWDTTNFRFLGLRDTHAHF